MLLLFTAVLVFYVAWNLGANDVANAMGTSVGSGAITLRQALVIAGILEFAGAVLFGDRVSTTLATEIVDPMLFAQNPQQWVMGMLAALISCGIWLQIATLLGLPVSSSHGIVGAIAGFGSVAVGIHQVNWHSLAIISLMWVLTPGVSGAIAALVYTTLKHWILDQPDTIQALYEWLPWINVALVGVLGWLVFPAILSPERLAELPLPPHTVFLGVGAIGCGVLTGFGWKYLAGLSATHSLTPHSLNPSESLFARFQILSACFVAFAHGANDVGNAVAPLAAIAATQRTGMVPTGGIAVPFWVLCLGGLGIVGGLAVLGKNVIRTVGEGIISLQPSLGFCAELGTAITILLATRLGLPVSTSHALVGAVVGVGLVRQLQSGRADAVRGNTLRQIVLAWGVTIPFCVALSAGLFTGLQWIWG